MNDIVLVGGFVKIGDYANFAAETEFILFQIVIDIFDNTGRNIFSEEGESIVAFFCNFIAGCVVDGLHFDESGFPQFV